MQSIPRITNAVTFFCTRRLTRRGRAAGGDSAHLTQAGSGRDQFGGGMHFFGIDWVGVNAENGRKLLLSVMFIGVVVLSSVILRALVGLVLGRTDHATVQTRFWTRQGVSLVAAFVLILGLLSIWFNDPTRLATAFGLMSAGLAFALQQVVTAIAGYFVILRGSTFTIGDRISMGGVRGDVLRLGFIQTTIMEMGQPPSVQATDPAMWVKSRQFTGRIVTVSNSKSSLNRSSTIPAISFIWEEMAIPITYQADRKRAEVILLDAAKRHAVDPPPWRSRPSTTCSVASAWSRSISSRGYSTALPTTGSADGALIVDTHRIRSAKDAMSRHIITELDKAGIGIPSATYDIVGFPPIKVRADGDAGAAQPAA